MTNSAAAVFGILLVVSLMVPLPHVGREVHSFFDMLHAPAFALLALLVQRAARRRAVKFDVRRALAVWVVLAAVGCLTEIAQSMVGRFSTWHDALANALGAAAGLLWAASSERRTLVMSLPSSVSTAVSLSGSNSGPIAV